MSVASTIEQKLTEALKPSSIEVFDDSHQHAGHGGARPEGETHFRVEITAEVFSGESKVNRQRMVYAALGDLMNNPIHALQLKTLAPGE